MNEINVKKIEYLESSFWILTAYCIGIFFDLSMKIEHGYWIPMTIGLIFLAIDQGQGAIIRKSIDRVTGTFIGVCLGFLYVNIFMASNYIWIYMLPFIWFTGFYFFYLTGNYSILTMMITVFVPILIAISNEESMASLGMGTTFIIRLSCTIIGVLIALIAVYFIYKKVSASAPEMKRNTDKIFKTQGGIIKSSTACYLGMETPERNLLDNMFRQTSSVSSIENIYLNIKYELDYRKDKENFYRYLFTSIGKINNYTRRLLCIIVHDKYAGAISDIDELKDIVSMLAEKYNNMSEYIDGKTDDCTERINKIIAGMNPEAIFTTDYLFLENLRDLSIIADELADINIFSNYPPDDTVLKKQ